MTAELFIVGPDAVPEISGAVDAKALISLLEDRPERFVAFPTGAAVSDFSNSRAALMAHATANPADLFIAVDGAGRREKRMLATEGLRFLDPTAALPMIIDRLAAITALSNPVIAACGVNWRWALARAVAEIGRLEIVVTGAKSPKRPIPVASMAMLDAYAGATTGHPSARRILVVGRIEASVSLYFDGLPPETAAMLRFIEAEALMAKIELMEKADAVVIVRDLERCHDLGLLDAMARLDMPRVWFIDDNPLVLAREDYHWAFYSEKRLRRLLEGFAGIFASTEPLADALLPLHPKVGVFPPVLDCRFIAAGDIDIAELSVAITGGGFRSNAFENDILPALETVRHLAPVRLVAPTNFARKAHGHIPTRFLEPRQSFPQFIRAWRRERPNVLVHPRSSTGNAPYKTPNALLVGLYLNSVPIVHAEEPAYSALTEHDAFVRSRSEDDYRAAFASLADPAQRQARLKALLGLCESLFDGRRNQAMLTELVDTRQSTRKRLGRVSLLSLPVRRATGRVARLVRQLRYKLRR